MKALSDKTSRKIVRLAACSHAHVPARWLHVPAHIYLKGRLYHCFICVLFCRHSGAHHPAQRPGRAAAAAGPPPHRADGPGALRCAALRCAALWFCSTVLVLRCACCIACCTGSAVFSCCAVPRAVLPGNAATRCQSMPCCAVLCCAACCAGAHACLPCLPSQQVQPDPLKAGIIPLKEQVLNCLWCSISACWFVLGHCCDGCASRPGGVEYAQCVMRAELLLTSQFQTSIHPTALHHARRHAAGDDNGNYFRAQRAAAFLHQLTFFLLLQFTPMFAAVQCAQRHAAGDNHGYHFYCCTCPSADPATFLPIPSIPQPYNANDDMLRATTMEIISTLKELLHLHPLYNEQMRNFIQVGLSMLGWTK